MPTAAGLTYVTLPLISNEIIPSFIYFKIVSVCLFWLFALISLSLNSCIISSTLSDSIGKYVKSLYANIGFCNYAYIYGYDYKEWKFSDLFDDCKCIKSLLEEYLS